VGKKLYKKQSGFVEKTIGNETVVVPLVNNVAQMDKVFSLNEVGSVIYNSLNESKTLDELLQIVLNEFDVEAETAKNDLEQFLDKAVFKEIVQEL
jgi:hypothetical protein